MDLHSKKILGYAYDTTMTAELEIKAITNAFLNVRDTKGILLHSNLEVQYTSEAFERFLKERGILHSFSHKRTPYDNAYMEPFHSVLKKEEVNPKEYADFKTAKQALFEYIKSWYNRNRIHSAINYITPQAAHSAT